MTRLDYAKALVITWAVTTLPFLIIGYGYSRSAQEFISGLGRAFITVPGTSKLAFNLFFFTPWIILLTWLIRRLFRVRRK